MRRQHSDPDDRVPRTPARKDRTRWCGGHQGREHQVSIVIPPNHSGYSGTCRPTPAWYRATPIFLKRLRPLWWCYHVHICTACGKHLWAATARECPDNPESV